METHQPQIRRDRRNLGILVFLAGILAASDIVTGYGKYSGLSNLTTLSTITRVLTPFFLIIFFWPHPKKIIYSYGISLLFLGILLPSLIFSYLNGYSTSSDARTIAKFALPYLCFPFFVGISRRIKVQVLASFFAIYGIFLLSTYFLNIGKSTYRTGSGWKGVFYSGNELSILLVVTFPFFVIAAWQLIKKIRDRLRPHLSRRLLGVTIPFLTASALLLTGIVGASISIIVATKSALLGVLATLIIFARIKLSNFWKYSCMFILLGLFAYPVINIIYVRLQTTKIRTKSLFMAVFEKRVIFTEHLVELLTDNEMGLIFGLGAGRSSQLLGGSTELDFFDLVSYFGLIPAATVFIALFSLGTVYIFKGRLWRPKVDASKLAFALAWVFYAGHATVAGHCLFSGMLAIPWAIILSELLRLKAPSKEFSSHSLGEI